MPDNLNIQNEYQQPKPKRKFFWRLLVFIVLLLALFGYLKFEISHALKPGAPTQAFTVQPGQSLAQISSSLQSQGLISNSFIFKNYARFTGNSGAIHSGTYVLSAGMSMRQILDELINATAKNRYEVVKIKEGWTVDEIASYLDQNGFAKKTDFLAAAQQLAESFSYYGNAPAQKSLEGFLFPDTYFYFNNTPSKDIIQKMLDNFDAKLSAQMRADISQSKFSTYQIVTLASIIEREVGRNTQTISDSDLQTLANERKIVAGIFYNRLRLGMPLQSDATLQYVTKSSSPQATDAQLKIDSPYNTYKYAGLPSGPISNPSLSSLMAAIYPAQTDYLYFLTKPDGTAVFAKTLQEQNANKQKYLK